MLKMYAVRCAGIAVAAGYLLLGACATVKPLPPPAAVASVPLAWDARVAMLQQLSSWDLSGRTAVAVGKQGWQASLNWQQRGATSEARLAGPLGVGATVLRLTDAGLSINGGPPSSSSSDAVSDLQQRLGFDLPLGNLRYWLLGVPDPATPFDLVRNDQDRAQTLTQDGWTMNYDHYLASNGDSLPVHVVLNRGDVRVRIVVDHWELRP